MRSYPPRLVLAFALLLSALPPTCNRHLAYATPLLPLTERETVRNDLIGEYVLHPNVDLVAQSAFCPANLTTTTFVFEPASAPSSLKAPKRFNIQIPHVNSMLAGRQCESSGAVMATTSSHPWAMEEEGALQTWANGTGSLRAEWISDRAIADISKSQWAMGVDFSERSCRGVILPGGAAFLWFQPRAAIFLGEQQLSGDTKYLAITFGARPKAGCLYVAEKVGGQEPFPTGPVSDPTNPTGGQQDASEGNVSEEDGDVSEEDGGAGDTEGDDSGDDGGADGAGAGEPVSGGTVTEDTTVSEEDNTEQPEQPPVSETEEPASPTTSPPTSTFGDASSSADPVLNDPGEVFGPSTGPDTEESSECFPSSAQVTLASGRQVAMSEVRSGMLVRTAHGAVSPVVLFSHRSVDAVSKFVNVTVWDAHMHASRSLLATRGHYVHGTSGLIAAGSLRAGDELRLATGRHGRVVGVRPAISTGLVAPHTRDGSMVVDGVGVSCYTTAVHPGLAHRVLMPLGDALFRLRASWIVERALSDGAPRLASLLPSGPVRL